ncbi:glycerophosphodiester phosphodiesterase family protein [Janibacter sp. DB-40]|uniref:glycerophosphodiester phosphodiesterase family protein n=1 Tax=Janibacter sp. DB-40 TaxID=3028808 RepID=UPI00240561EF|nr:glycerophosphodiester phosphodiesterase family protein [Janibacter sp. DB-40]
MSTDILVLAHRGASGYRPEHTLAAYELAVGMGADYIEPDLVMTRDGVLVDRHEPEIAQTTDVAEHPRFADRMTAKEIDGVVVTGWFAEDFTVEELQGLRATERLAQLRPESVTHEGSLRVLTFDEVLQQRADLTRTSGRTIGIVPEIKHSTYLRGHGFDPELEVLRLLEEHDLNSATAPVWLQSFEPTALRALRAHGYRGRSMLLTEAQGAPFDLREQGTTCVELTTPPAMERLAPWVDALAPAKEQVIPWTPEGALGEPTRLVDDAHEAGLEVFPWTFRAENAFLPADHRIGAGPAAHGRMVDEVVAHLEAGVDGVFCDHPDVGVEARTQFVTAR